MHKWQTYAKVDRVNLIVGIPTRNESATIAKVVETVDAGLRAAFPGARTVIINADSSSPDGTSAIFSSVDTMSKKVALTTSADNTGKGSNVFAIMEAARELGADALCLVDGDLRSIELSWPKMLLGGALERDTPTFLTPEYTRSRFEANTTNQLVVPYLRAAFGLDVRQPIGGEFAMNASFIDHALNWSRSESTNLYGIDVWLTVNAALHNLTLDSVFIGRKVHNPTFPKIFRLGQEVLDTLFRLMMLHRPANPLLAAVDVTVDNRVDEEGAPLSPSLVQPIIARASAYIEQNWDDIVFTFPSLLAVKPAVGSQLPHIETELWCEILADAYGQLDLNNFRIVRDRLVALFPARVISHWAEIAYMSAKEVDELLEFQNSRLAQLFTERPLPGVSVDASVSPALGDTYWRKSEFETHAAA